VSRLVSITDHRLLEDYSMLQDVNLLCWTELDNKILRWCLMLFLVCGVAKAKRNALDLKEIAL